MADDFLETLQPAEQAKSRGRTTKKKEYQFRFVVYGEGKTPQEAWKYLMDTGGAFEFMGSNALPEWSDDGKTWHKL